MTHKPPSRILTAIKKSNVRVMLYEQTKQFG